MADQADVENALAALVANALYPGGTGAPSAVGVVCRVYRGFPVAPSLEADMAAGVVHVTIAPDGGGVRNVSRYPQRWQVVKPVAQSLSVSVSGTSAVFSGVCAVGQLAGILVDGNAFPYAVQANDSAATVASNMAAQIRAAGWIVEYAGTGLAVPAAVSFSARVVAGAGALKEMRRQVQDFRISIWCPDPGSRDVVAPVVDLGVMAENFVLLADGSCGRVLFVREETVDSSADAALYRRDLVYSVEYPTTVAEIEPAMLFGSVAATVNSVFLENYQG